MINRLVIASNNSAKTREIVAVFATFGMTAVNYRELMPEKHFRQKQRMINLRMRWLKHSLSSNFYLMNSF